MKLVADGPRLSFLLVTICCWISPSAQAEEGSRALDQDREKLMHLDQSVRGIIGDAACTDNTDCRLMGYGSKPCGGPAGYVAYSIKGTNVALLEEKVLEFNALALELDRRTGTVSDCTLASKPEVKCVQGRCFAKGAFHSEPNIPLQRQTEASTAC